MASHLRHCHSDHPSVILNAAPTPTVILNAAKRSEESKVTALNAAPTHPVILNATESKNLKSTNTRPDSQYKSTPRTITV